MKRYAKYIPILAVFILVLVSTCLASEEGGGGGKKIWDMAWRIINFLILAGILWKLLADKVKAYFSDRRVEIAEMLQEADEAKAEAEKQFTEVQDKLKNVEKDIQEIRNAIMGELENEKQRIIDEGKAVSERIIQQAHWSAEQEVIKAKNDLRNQVVDMAGDMAAGMVSKNMTPDDQKKIIEEYLQKVVREN
ncbi:MAG: ATP synthase F0 subunit B [Desulfomonilia bacterium]